MELGPVSVSTPLPSTVGLSCSSGALCHPVKHIPGPGVRTAAGTPKGLAAGPQAKRTQQISNHMGKQQVCALLGPSNYIKNLDLATLPLPSQSHIKHLSWPTYPGIMQ